MHDDVGNIYNWGTLYFELFEFYCILKLIN